MAELTEFKPGTVLAGKYNIHHVEGAIEGSCRFYAARDSLEDRWWWVRQFALPWDKAARRDFMAWFYDEGARQAELRHPQLPRVAEFVLEKGYAWTVSEFREGEVLAPLPVEEPVATVRASLRSLAELLQFLHEQDVPMTRGGFLPSDLRVERGLVCLKDLGVLRLFPAEQRSSLQGVDPHVDPIPGEVRARHGGESLHRRFDIWSLGALAWWMLTERPAPVNESDHWHLDELRPDVEADLVEFVERCLGGGGRTPFFSASEAVAWLRREPAPDNPSRISLRPDTLRLTHVSTESVALTGFHIENDGGGVLAATVSSDSPWLHVSPQSFEGNEQEIQVWVDPAQLTGQTEAKGNIRIKTEHDERLLPVEVEMQPARLSRVSLGMLAGLLLGLSGGATLGLLYARNWMVKAGSVLLASSAAAPSPASVAVLNRARWLVMGELLLVLLLPLLLTLLVKLAAPHVRQQARFFYLLAILLPALAHWAAFPNRPLDLMPRGGDMSLARLNPHLVDRPMLLISCIVAMLAVTPVSRYPAPLRDKPRARRLALAVLTALYAYTFYYYGVR